MHQAKLESPACPLPSTSSMTPYAPVSACPSKRFVFSPLHSPLPVHAATATSTTTTCEIIGPHLCIRNLPPAQHTHTHTHTQTSWELLQSVFAVMAPYSFLGRFEQLMRAQKTLTLTARIRTGEGCRRDDGSFHAFNTTVSGLSGSERMNWQKPRASTKGHAARHADEEASTVRQEASSLEAGDHVFDTAFSSLSERLNVELRQAGLMNDPRKTRQRARGKDAWKHRADRQAQAASDGAGADVQRMPLIGATDNVAGEGHASLQRTLRRHAWEAVRRRTQQDIVAGELHVWLHAVPTVTSAVSGTGTDKLTPNQSASLVPGSEADSADRPGGDSKEAGQAAVAGNRPADHANDPLGNARRRGKQQVLQEAGAQFSVEFLAGGVGGPLPMLPSGSGTGDDMDAAAAAAAGAPSMPLHFPLYLAHFSSGGRARADGPADGPCGKMAPRLIPPNSAIAVIVPGPAAGGPASPSSAGAAGGANVQAGCSLEDMLGAVQAFSPAVVLLLGNSAMEPDAAFAHPLVSLPAFLNASVADLAGLGDTMAALKLPQVTTTGHPGSGAEAREANGRLNTHPEDVEASTEGVVNVAQGQGQDGSGSSWSYDAVSMPPTGTRVPLATAVVRVPPMAASMLLLEVCESLGQDCGLAGDTGDMSGSVDRDHLEHALSVQEGALGFVALANDLEVDRYWRDVRRVHAAAEDPEAWPKTQAGQRQAVAALTSVHGKVGEWFGEVVEGALAVGAVRAASSEEGPRARRTLALGAVASEARKRGANGGHRFTRAASQQQAFSGGKDGSADVALLQEPLPGSPDRALVMHLLEQQRQARIRSKEEPAGAPRRYDAAPEAATAPSGRGDNTPEKRHGRKSRRSRMRSPRGDL